MKSSIGICVVLFATVYAATDSWTGLTFKVPIPGTVKNVNWGFEAPVFIGETVASGDWIEIELENLYNLRALSLKVDYDFAFNPLYDVNGYLAGAQVCQPFDVISSTQPPSYDPIAVGTIEKKTISGKEYYCSSFLLLSPDSIISGTRSVLTGSIGEGLWIRDTTNCEIGYVKVTDTISELVSTTNYKQQACIPNMGTHFLPNGDANLNCSNAFNWVPIGNVATDTINGLVFQTFGSATTFYNPIPESPTRAIASAIFPDVECIADYVETNGAIALHIFFNDFPENIVC